MHINAPDLVVFKFLSTKINDKSILEYFEKSDFLPLIKVFGVDENTILEWQNGFLNAVTNLDQRTNKFIKQVYFPVDNGYHQLSLLAASGLCFKLKERIDYLNIQSPDTYAGRHFKKNNQMFNNEFGSVIEITYQRHGGDHPKNISGLNNKHQNIALLRSTMPELNKNYKFLPTFNFFSQTIRPKKYANSFNSLHKLLIVDVNNINIREGRDNIIHFVAEEIIEEVWTIRSAPSGWSNGERHNALPKYQKIVLDYARGESTIIEEIWIDEFIHEMARWFISTYKKILGNDALPFHDDEMRHVQNIMFKSKGDLQ